MRSRSREEMRRRRRERASGALQDDVRRGQGSSARAAPATVLVASFLVIRAPLSAHAAPRPVQTPGPSYFSSRQTGGASGIAGSVGRRRTPGRRALADDVDDVIDAQSDDESWSAWPVAPEEMYKPSIEFSATPTRRDFSKRETMPVTSAVGRAITIPPSFASNIASSWDPGRRSIWFQRKAVIITSIFLAIFIVLIIGCTVFLRDKRDYDSEDEDFDESDEAALARMREEREMRQGSSREKRQSKEEKKKKSKKMKRRGDKAENGGNSKELGKEETLSSTALAASRWSKLPVRRIRLRKRTSKESSSHEHRSSAEAGRDAVSQATHSSSEGGDVRSHSTVDTPNAGSTLVATSSGHPSHDGDSGAAASVTPNGQQPASYAEVAGHLDSQRTHDGSVPPEGASGSTPPRTNLTAADLAAADAAGTSSEADLEAVPPAYRPNSHQQNGTAAGAGSRGSQPVRRRLAGQEEEEEEQEQEQHQRALAEARGDAKHPAVEDENHISADSDNATPSEPLPGSVAASQASRAVQPRQSGRNLQGHIATDDKDALGLLRAAASHPDAAPQYAPSAPGVSDGASQGPSAPDFDDEAANDPSLDVHSLRMAPIDGKGKATGSTDQLAGSSSRLPPPPSAQTDATFSRFDMPYAFEQPRRSSASIGASSPTRPQRLSEQTVGATMSSKEREAAEEERQAMALLASQPSDEGQGLPRYERKTSVRGNSNSAAPAPSAPPADDDEEEVVVEEEGGGNGGAEPADAARHVESLATAPNAAPSAPSLDDEGEAGSLSTS